jgi:LysM repeat protein
MLASLIGLTLLGCERPDPEVTIIAPAVTVNVPPTPQITPHTGGGSAPPTPILLGVVATAMPSYPGTPTPDPPHTLVTEDNQPFTVHIVGAGETLGYIAQIHGSSVEELLVTNQLAESDFLFIGQEILVPVQAELVSPSFKIIPDSELVYGPAAKGFDVRDYVTPWNGYLLGYDEEVEGRVLAGPEIVSLVAERYSVNPRLLLAILEYRAGWITRPDVLDDGHPLGYRKESGLYKQLGWAANEFNWGYYGRGEGGITSLLIGDVTRVAFAADINHGTAGVQNMLGADERATYDRWLMDVDPTGFFATYSRLFGNPFAYTVDPLWPSDLAQPPLQLPWSKGESWYFTGGPHGGWAAGAAWAALDFAPTDEELGLCQSALWATAMADGIVIRSDFGGVVVDTDGDEYAGTGWVFTYMHLESRDRVPLGTFVQTGDRLGHPSCEGGFSSVKHLHVGRTYNGRWVAADGPIPFEMSGWTTVGLGREYDGQLVRGGVIKEACNGCRDESNTITAD